MRLTLLSCLASAALLAAAGTANAIPIAAGEQAGSVNTAQSQPTDNDEFSARRGGGGFGRGGGGGGGMRMGGGGGRMHFGGGGGHRVHFGGGGHRVHFGGHRIRHAGFVGHRHGFRHHRFVGHKFHHRRFVHRHKFRRFGHVFVGGSWCHTHWRRGFIFRHCHPYAFYPHRHGWGWRYAGW
jgi:hypothetical protein